mgnify:CR=1 FL=1
MSHFLVGAQREQLKEIGLYDENHLVLNLCKGSSVTTEKGYKIVCGERYEEEEDKGAIAVLIDVIHPDGDDLSFFNLTFCYESAVGDEWHLVGLI